MDVGRITQLYENVLSYDILKYDIKEQDIIVGIESMRDVYKPDMSNLSSSRSSVANYNDPAHRCAYLHKYAALHTVMVQDFFLKVIHTNYRLFYDQVYSQQKYSICCLGGGPGNDVIAVLSALHQVFSYFPVAATVVDYMADWQFSFHSILRELGSGCYGAFGNNAHHKLNWRYLEANLLKALDPQVKDAIKTSNLVTMVKFASATACKNTEDMINNVFYLMKPGAVLFFVDNAAGGYREIVMNAATKYKFVPIYGPIRHEEYLNYDTRVHRFGFVSCHRTTVSWHVWMKPLRSGRPLLDPYQLSFPQFSPIVSPPPPRSLYAESPLTPFVYVAGSQSDSTQEGISAVHSPAPSLLATPKYKKMTKRSQAGCLPIHRWRHHIGRKITNVKSRAHNLVNIVRKKHPVFRL